jgi:flagellar motor switch protein FliG
MSTALADLSAPRKLTNRQKAAVIVRLLLSEGVEVPIGDLPEGMQEDLTQQLADMQSIDRATLKAVTEEFLATIDSIGLSFPRGLGDALGLLESHISPSAAQRVRKRSGVPISGDPWQIIADLPPEKLEPILVNEAPEVGAILLSKLPVKRAAELLEVLPGDRARRLSIAIRQTSVVGPETVRRIGVSLAEQLDNQPDIAFDDSPVERVGAILNSSRAKTRDDVLAGLDEEDQQFAKAVRQSIFTYANLPQRLAASDVPKAVRVLEQDILLRALAAGTEAHPESTEFILNNMSKRMAESLRDEMAELGEIKAADGEDAMAAVIEAIRDLANAGTILLVAEEDQDPDI